MMIFFLPKDTEKRANINVIKKETEKTDAIVKARTPN